MTQHLFLIVAEHGLLIVFVNVLADQIGLPVPAVPTLIVAGAIAADGGLPLIPLFAWSVLAVCMADCLWFLIGRIYGLRVLKLLCRISLEPDSCVGQTQSRFENWGVKSLVVAKFIPGLSIIAPPLAGALRIGWPRFLALTLSSAVLWVGSALAVGMLFKTQIAGVLAHLDAIGGGGALLVGGALALYLLYKWWERQRFYKSLRMARIEVSDLHDIIQAGAKPVIVDVRSTTARALDPRGIPGARYIPMENMASHLADLPRDRDIVLYCACPNEATAARVAKLLMKHGFTKVRPLQGGLDAWVAAGYAYEKA